MADDWGNRVRIELTEGFSFDPAHPQLSPEQVAEVFLPKAGKFTAKKPAVRLIAETRPELLRTIADWMERNEDPGLAGLAKEWQERQAEREARKKGNR